MVAPSEVNELAKALVKAQASIEGAKKGKKNDHFRSKYADLAAVWDACREALCDNGLSVIQLPCEAPPGHVGLNTLLLHTSGQCLGDKFYMPVKDPTNPQAVGSALTYARRYALAAAVGVCPEDDDGNAAAAPSKAVQRSPEGQDPGGANPASGGPTKEDFQNSFAYQLGANNLAGMKSVYSTLRNSAVQEPGKTQLLSEFGKHIKSFQEKK